jgi:hypothetical protein
MLPVIWASLAIVAAVAAGCAGSKSAAPAATERVVDVAEGPLAELAINVDTSRIPSDRKDEFDSLQGAPRLARAVRAQIVQQGRRLAMPGSLNVVVTDFRLRSTTNVALWGPLMTGGDALGVGVNVFSNGQEVRSFKTGAGQVYAGSIGPTTAEDRFERLVEARRVSMR